MELRQLEIFHASARLLNFTRAAEELGYAQSNVTKQIQNLERELGTALFERLGKKVFLTPEGELFEKKVQEILFAIENAKAEVNPAHFEGTLRVGAAESICVNRLPKIFQSYARRYPGVHLELQMDSCYRLADRLREHVIDVAIALAGSIDEPDMTVTRVREEPMCLVAHPLSALAQLGSITPYDLQDATLITTMEGCGYRPLILAMLARYGVTPARRMELPSVAAIKACVLADMGVAILPEIAVKDDIAKGALVPVTMDFETFHVYVQLFYHRDKWLSPALQRFLAACQ